MTEQEIDQLSYTQLDDAIHRFIMGASNTTPVRLRYSEDINYCHKAEMKFGKYKNLEYSRYLEYELLESKALDMAMNRRTFTIATCPPVIRCRALLKAKFNVKKWQF